MKHKHHTSNGNKNAHVASSLHDLLPRDQVSHNALIQRAKNIAVEKQLERKDEYYLGGVCIRLGKNDKYAIPYTDVVEVLRSQSITALPKMPEMIAGVTNWRGKILTVIDMRHLFSIKDKNENPDNGIVIVSCNGNVIGMQVSEILGSQKYDPSLLEAPLPMKGMVKPVYISGLLRGTIAVLNLNPIFADIQVALQK